MNAALVVPQRDLFRVYEEAGQDGYPAEWHRLLYDDLGIGVLTERAPGIKDLVREQAGHRCVRCGHPYRKGMGEWSPCDESCTHEDGDGCTHALWQPGEGGGAYRPEPGENVDMWRRRALVRGMVVHSRWRILTVHHLNGVKLDCRWWNLASLCQRCHLTIQGRVVMARVWPWEHTAWFQPYVAGYYASVYLGEELTREETVARLDELLALERAGGTTGAAEPRPPDPGLLSDQAAGVL